MSLPTMSQVVYEIRLYENRHYAQAVREMLDKIQRLNQNNVDQFNDYLVSLLNDARYDKSFKRTISKTVLVLGQLFPRNTIQDGEVIDPITLEKIVPNDIFISLDRYHWSIRSLIKFFSTKTTYINPLTNVEFSSLDAYHIQKIAAQYRLTISFHKNADNRSSPSHRQRMRDLEISSLLYSFFKHADVSQRGHVVMCPIPFVGAYLYTGHR